MNSLYGILRKELIEPDSKLNILFTHADNKQFVSMIRKMGHKILCYDDLYFGNMSPDLIICNDKIISYQKVSIIAIQFHIPVIVVDHGPPDSIIDSSKIDTINNITNSYKIALNQNIYDAWNRIHHQILDIDHNTTEQWKSLLSITAKGLFTL